MLTHPTLEQMQTLGLAGMAAAYRDMSERQTNDSLSRDEWLGLMLDYESERVIQTNMRQIVQGRTVIIIAHRLAAVRPCNRIVGMADGRIVEIGSHAELLAKPDGVYARLWALQNDRMEAAE